MKKIRMILPAIAILFAVATAFVTYASPKVVTDIFVDYDQVDCEALATCTPGGSVSCLADARQELNLNEIQFPAIYDVDSTPTICASVNPTAEFTEL